ncbi:class I SAM-dependent methyltransferase [Paenibacillus sp. LjRoot153]|uniref:class I SAM-dependent methyltransferase n=1 Tax=Paenibacillus sp. LjRoot153 TaxID=3342270 RepID=UPI003ECE62A6
MIKRNNLFQRIMEIQNDSSLHDFGGGSPLNKCYIMAYLITKFRLKNYVEIGVYKGRSLFSVSQAIKDNNGTAYGIDPYALNEAKQHDMEEDIRDKVNHFLEELEFDDLYKNVVLKQEALELKNVIELIRKTSSQAVKDLKHIEIDMLHIDGNHDYNHVLEDITNYAPLIKDGGIIVFDDINWDSVRRCYDDIKQNYIVLLETEYFGILIKKEKSQKNVDHANLTSNKLKNLFIKLLDIEQRIESKRPTVNVGVLVYNHENFILQCLQSIVTQKGDFDLKVVVCEDKSTDNTAEYIESFIKSSQIPNGVSLVYLKNKENLGMVKNLQRLLEACRGSDFLALIDGDDYWKEENKLQDHIDFLGSHPECALSFDSILFYWENQDNFGLYPLQQAATKEIFTTEDIIQDNIIGNISCCFYDAKYLDQIPDDLFTFFVGDWLLNIVYSQFGDIGFIKKPMTVYRKHDNGIWTGDRVFHDEFEKRKIIIESIDKCNQLLDFLYDEEFSKVKHKLRV